MLDAECYLTPYMLRYGYIDAAENIIGLSLMLITMLILTDTWNYIKLYYTYNITEEDVIFGIEINGK